MTTSPLASDDTLEIPAVSPWMRTSLDECVGTRNERPNLARTLGEHRYRDVSGAHTLVPSTQEALILLVDDDPQNIEWVRSHLQGLGNPQIISTIDPRDAVHLAQKHQPDLILLDFQMPIVNGLDILYDVRHDPSLRTTPVIILTTSNRPDVRMQALEWGVNEFLSKPVDPAELLLRIRNTLNAKSLQDRLSNYSAQLEREVSQRTLELEAARQEAMECLARAAEYRDDDTGRHILRVGRYVAILATTLGYSKNDVHLLEQAAHLHDVGKIGIPDAVLLKPGPLSPAEYELMKDHCLFGRSIIHPTSDDEWQNVRRQTLTQDPAPRTTSSPLMRLAASIAATHHEKWDGSGYPFGLRGDQIPPEGRITAVADVFDALSTKRPYKPAFPPTHCVQAIVAGRGKHFDPQVVDAFIESLDEILLVQNDLADP